jgi:hypothetical protein
MNEDPFPRLVNIKAKLEFPPALKDDPKTIENLHQWNDYLDEVKKKLKIKVLAQSDCTCEFLHKERFGLFMEKNVAISEGYDAYHRQLEGTEGGPLSNQTYGAAGVYCYYPRLPAGHEVFQYLREDKSTSLAEVKAKYLITADGSSAFHASQLLALSNFPVTPGQVAATPQQLPPPAAAPMRPPGNSPMANAQSQNLLEPEEEEKEPDPQPRNPYRCTVVPLAQPTPETEPQDRNRTDPSEAQVLALTGNARPAVHRICTILKDLVPPLFLKISDSTKEDQLVQKTNAKLEAALKKKATLDMGQVLDDSISKEPTVAQENMEGLVQSIVQRQLKNVEKRKKNEIIKEALKEARKQSSGGENGKNNQTQQAAQWQNAKRVIEKLCKPFSASETCEEETIQRPRQGLCAMATLAAEPVLESRPATHASRQPPLSLWTVLKGMVFLLRRYPIKIQQSYFTIPSIILCWL